MLQLLLLSPLKRLVVGGSCIVRVKRFFHPAGVPRHQSPPEKKKKRPLGFGVLAHPNGRPFRRLSRTTSPERRNVLYIALLIDDFLTTPVCAQREPGVSALTFL